MKYIKSFKSNQSNITYYTFETGSIRIELSNDHIKNGVRSKGLFGVNFSDRTRIFIREHILNDYISRIKKEYPELLL